MNIFKLIQDVAFAHLNKSVDLELKNTLKSKAYRKASKQKGAK